MPDNQKPTTDLHRDLLAAVDAGLVSRRVRGPLAIYNYTPACAYGRKWTPVTMAARGLILEEATGRVIARPFPKFFNVGEMPETAADVLPWDQPHEVTEKMDGSLGIVFWYDGKWDIATRGAFESPQAVYAREHLLSRYKLGMVRRDLTLLTEIVYPANRIVVDYGERDELVLLAVTTECGELPWPGVESMGQEIGVPVAMRADSDPVRDYTMGISTRIVVEGSARRIADRKSRIARESDATASDVFEKNTEGFVIHWPATGLRVKVKSEEYTAAHRMLSQVTPRRVLESIAEGKDDDLAAQLPEHIRETFDAIRDELVGKVMDLEEAADAAWNRHGHLIATGRKDFALAIEHELSAVKALLFAMADEKPEDKIRAMAIRAVGKTLKTEDVSLGG